MDTKVHERRATPPEDKRTARMVRLDKIYTKGGDGGQTGLSDGSRISKASLRITAIGAVDETNSAIGIARLDSTGDTGAIGFDDFRGLDRHRNTQFLRTGRIIAVKLWGASALNWRSGEEFCHLARSEERCGHKSP